jgi:hypothetical protein
MTKVIPFLDAHPPIVKSEVYTIWKEAIALIKANSVESELPFHALTEESMQSLFQLKLRMEELMPSSRSPKQRRGRWRKHITTLNDTAPDTDKKYRNVEQVRNKIYN